MEELKLTLHALALPICRIQQEGDKHRHIVSQIIGTGFGIGGVYLMTAAHVLKELTALQYSVVLIQNPETNVFHIAPVVDVEILHADIGILEINPREGNLWFGRASWSSTPLSVFQRIQAVGYPYALEVVGGRTHIIQRGFEGHLVAHLREYLPDGMSGAPFSAYEVSFAAPRGLSGAPLWTITANNVRVHGVVIANSKSSMLVLSDLSEKMIEKDGQRNEMTTIFERHESMSLGIAVDILTIKQLKSGLLGSTIGEFLAANDLLAP